MGAVEKLTLKLTSASTGVGVEAWAELGKISREQVHKFPYFVYIVKQDGNFRVVQFLPSSAQASTPTSVEAEVSFNISFCTPPSPPTCIPCHKSNYLKFIVKF